MGAIAAIVDILESNVDGSPGSDGEPVLDAKQVPSAVSVLAGAMRMHQIHKPLQQLGSYCIGQLCSFLPSDQDPPGDAVESLIAALRRHPNDYKVASGVLGAVRILLSPRSGVEGAAALSRMVVALRGPFPII